MLLIHIFPHPALSEAWEPPASGLFREVAPFGLPPQPGVQLSLRSTCPYSEHRVRAVPDRSPQLSRNPEHDSHTATEREREVSPEREFWKQRSYWASARTDLGFCPDQRDPLPTPHNSAPASLTSPLRAAILSHQPRTLDPQPRFTPPHSQNGNTEGLFRFPEPGQQCQGPGVWPCVPGQDGRTRASWTVPF